MGHENHVSLGRVRLEKDDLFEDQMESLGINAVLALQPDSWKNIPSPIINAIKLVIDCQNKTHKKLFETQILLEETGQRQQATLNRLTKELQKQTEHLETSIKMTEITINKSL